jgi:hypothetical protein
MRENRTGALVPSISNSFGSISRSKNNPCGAFQSFAIFENKEKLLYREYVKIKQKSKKKREKRKTKNEKRLKFKYIKSIKRIIYKEGRLNIGSRQCGTHLHLPGVVLLENM